MLWLILGIIISLWLKNMKLQMEQCVFPIKELDAILFPQSLSTENNLPPSFRRRRLFISRISSKRDWEVNGIHPSFRWSWRRSAIMAMNSLLVGFPLTLETV